MRPPQTNPKTNSPPVHLWDIRDMVLVVMGETTVKETGIKNDVGPFAKASSFGLPTPGAVHELNESP